MICWILNGWMKRSGDRKQMKAYYHENAERFRKMEEDAFEIRFVKVKFCVFRSGDDLPLEYGASADGLYFPNTLNDAIERQIRKGDFLNAIFSCPYDIHELVADEYLSAILHDLSEDHKELLFLCAVRLFSSTRIAAIRQQSDRNIGKVRTTMLKRIRKKLLASLSEKANKQQPLTLLEKEFLQDNGSETDKSIDGRKKK